MSDINNGEPRSAESPRKPWFVVFASAFLFVFLCLIALAPSMFGQQKGSTVRGYGQDDQQYLGTIQALNEFIRNNYVDTVDPSVLYEGALKGMFDALGDPYSIYLDSEEMRKLTDTTTGEFGGVGMYIDKQRSPEGKILPNGFVEVVSPIEDTPAFREGIQPGDLIVEINGKSTAELSLDEAVASLRGPIGTKVDIRVFRGQTMDLKKSIIRSKIEIPTVKGGMIGNVAYLRLIQFTPLTVEQLSAKLVEFNKAGYKALVLDMRNNPGGVLDGAVQIADLFFDDGVIVSTKGRVAYENEVHNANPGTLVDPSIPIVCLVNDGSASASEILSGALKDRGRALFVGTKTYGKGSVQTVRSVGDRGFRMTIARYYTPSGISIDKIGISPDIEIKEPVFTKDEEYSYLKLQELNLIPAIAAKYGPDYAKSGPAILASLKEKGIILPERIVLRLVRAELDRKANVTRDYDLEFDTGLQEALRIIKAGDVEKLIKARPVATASPASASPSPAKEALPAPTLK